MSQQPPVTDYFNVKRKVDGQVTKSNSVSDDDDTNAETCKEIQDGSSSSEQSLAVSANLESGVERPRPGTESPIKLPRLSLISSHSPSISGITESEASRLFLAGPPRLTPIKNGIPILNSPVREYRRAGFDQGSVSFPSSTHCTSPSKALATSGSPLSRGSPLKPAPEFVKKSVVKKLFCIGDVGDDEGNGVSTAQEPPLPAYKRFAHLTVPNEEHQSDETLQPTELYASTLPLPYNYNIVQEVFRAVETVSSLLYNRSEAITFSKLRGKVSDLLRKPTLQKVHISQILTVLPNAYDLSWVKGDIMLRPNIEKLNGSRSRMDHEVLMSRRREFTKNLIGICYRHHQDFLASLVPPIQLPVGKSLTRWHPSFPLDSVPEIAPAALPPKPESQSQTSSPVKTPISGSGSVRNSDDSRLRKAKVMQSEITKAKEALLAIRNSKMNPKTSSIALLDQPTRTIRRDKAPSAIQTISKTLLEKIRAREQLKAIRSMTLTPEETRDRELLTRLPNYVRIIRNAILIENKSVIPLHVLTRRLMNSQSQICRESEVEEHFRLLEKIVPDWLKILKGTQGPYVKIDKDIDINGIVEQVEVLIHKSGESLFK